MVFEGDELTVFGVISYNVRSDEFTIDDPVGFFQNGQREQLLTTMKDRAGKVAWDVIEKALVAGGLLACGAYFLKIAYKRYR